MLVLSIFVFKSLLLLEILSFAQLSLELLSGLFSGSEIAYLSANKLRVELLKNKGTRQGRIVYGFFNKPSEFLGILLVGNNIALVIFSELMAEKLEVNSLCCEFIWFIHECNATYKI